MQYTLLLAAAVLAQRSTAHPQDHHNHGRLHENRDAQAEVVVTDVAVDVVTDVQYYTVTAGEPGNNGPPAAPTEAAAVESSPAAAWSSSSEAPPSPPPAAPTTFATSYSQAPTSSATPPPPASSAAPTSSAPASSASSGISTSSLTPNGKKHGFSGYPGIQNMAAFGELAPYISWYSDYTPNTPTEQGVQGIPMLWGATGSPCGSVMTNRLATFNSMIQNGTVPEIMFGFYEPDCDCEGDMSSDMAVSDAASGWDSLLAPLGSKGTVLGSPSMCKQYDEDFLTPFQSAISRPWDVTSIHINKPNVSEAQKDVEYYWNKYNKPIWVSEFACVHDQPSFQPCTDQGEVNSFIQGMVQYLEGNDNVVAYGPSNGEGLGTVWPLTTSDGQLSTSGQTYLAAIKAL